MTVRDSGSLLLGVYSLRIGEDCLGDDPGEDMDGDGNSGDDDLPDFSILRHMGDVASTSIALWGEDPDEVGCLLPNKYIGFIVQVLIPESSFRLSVLSIFLFIQIIQQTKIKHNQF